MALAAPAGMGQGVTEISHSQTSKARSHHHQQHRRKQRHHPSLHTDTPDFQGSLAANVKFLIEQLEAGHSEGLTAHLTAMGRFYNYSFGNILEVAQQKPDAAQDVGTNYQHGRQLSVALDLRLIFDILAFQSRLNQIYNIYGYFFFV